MRPAKEPAWKSSPIGGISRTLACASGSSAKCAGCAPRRCAGTSSRRCTRCYGAGDRKVHTGSRSVPPDFPNRETHVNATDTATTTTVIEMKRGATMRLDGGRGAVVRVVSGNVWLTQYKDAADHVMQAGNWVVLMGEGSTLIYAFEDSSLRFAAADRALPPCFSAQQDRRQFV